MSDALLLLSNKRALKYYKNRVFGKYPAFMLFYSLQQTEKSNEEKRSDGKAVLDW